MADKFYAQLSIDKEKAKAVMEDNGLSVDGDMADYIYNEFGWLEQSGITLHGLLSVEGSSTRTRWQRYINYVLKWAFENGKKEGYYVDELLPFKEWKNKDLKEVIISTAEDLDWSVDFDEEEKTVEFAQSSPMGEDFSFIVFYDEIDDIPNKVDDYNTSFDIDEHVEMWINAKNSGTSGVPSVKELVEDADEIQQMIGKLSDALFNAWTNYV